MAEAAAAVLDDEAPDGGAPPALRLLGGVLGRQVEVVQQVLLHGCTCTRSLGRSGAERDGVGGCGAGVREHHHLPLPPPRWLRCTGTTTTNTTKEKTREETASCRPCPCLFTLGSQIQGGRKEGGAIWVEP